MILVDIYVPAVDKTYDFQLNENTQISAVIDEIIEMVGQKERSVLWGDSGEVLLCEKGSERILNREDTLYNAGVVTGKTLILV